MARSRKRRRHCQVLIALQRAYGGPVQTLEVTIVSLLPPSPSSPAQCSCCGRGCLGCGSSAYLLQKDDPVDYRILLTRGFCVVSRDAPPPPKLFTGDIPHPLKSHSSTVDQLLHTPNWNLLLRRIGSELMIYLLRFSSIFIPIQRKSYYQLTGHPMNIVFRGSKILNTPSMSCNHDPFSKTMQNMALPNNKQKRKRDSINERSNMGSAAVPDPNTLFMIVSSESESLVSKANKKQRISKDPKRVIDRKKDVKLDGDELDMRFLSKDRFQNTSLNDSYSSGDCLSNKLRKQGRLFRWQRQRIKKARQENISGGRDMEISKMELLDSECNSCPPLQLSGTITSSASTEICSMCFYCFMMHHSQEVKTGVEIKRSYIFYNKSPSYSVFPRSHILNRLKPNDSDAIRLMKHIFGFPDGDKSFLTCIDCSHGSGIESQCFFMKSSTLGSNNREVEGDTVFFLLGSRELGRN
ncbi:telomerase reverse transcriptase isoform X6 [Canna indica]|uniref:Telomerase reverse transcriptase n=1 Tax=Canna indica TaxID=4628 RepID=A0AAQ3QTL3_9LILI|nr:telomerase reverse transcriptase isoform X6 [Canna indica]